MHFNTLDAEMGRRFFLNKSLKMRLHGGIKSCWIKQNYNIEYKDGNTAQIPPIRFPLQFVQFLQSTIEYHTDTWGIGPKVGFDSEWKVWGGWNIIADGSFSLVYSFFDIKRNQTDLDLMITGTSPAPVTRTLETFTANLKQDFSQFMPVLELSLGTEWGTCIGSKNSPYFILLGINYETQLWWELNQIPKFINSTYNGEAYNVDGYLQTQGLVLKMELDF